MSLLQMQQSKERAQHAKKSARYRKIGLDEKVDLRRLNDPHFATVRSGITGARLNPETLCVEVMKGEEVVESIGDQMSERLDIISASLSGKQKAKFQRDLQDVKGEYKRIIDRFEWRDKIKPDVKSLPQWDADLIMQRPTRSMTGDMIDAHRREDRLLCDPETKEALKHSHFATGHNVIPFIIEHDWAAAFDGAEDFEDGAVRMPYDVMMFEFRFSGRSVLYFTAEDASVPKLIFVQLSTSRS